jgi:hypothetical protein
MNITHPSLYRPDEDFLLPEFIDAIGEANHILDKNGGEMETAASQFINLGIVDKLVTTHANDIFTFPVFKPEFSQMMLEEVLNCGIDWERNPEEDEYRSMPEITLNAISHKLSDAYKYYVLELFSYVTEDYWKIHSNMMTVAQVAKYDPVNQVGGHWHHDASSDITFVTPLSYGFEGGGTEFLNQKIILKPLQLGHVVCFPGRVTHLHRGKAVTKGERYILTAWTKIIDGAY